MAYDSKCAECKHGETVSIGLYLWEGWCWRDYRGGSFPPHSQKTARDTSCGPDARLFEPKEKA